MESAVHGQGRRAFFGFVAQPRRGLAALCWATSFLVPTSAAAQCRETPSVHMDEQTAESHLLAKRDPELPPGASGLVQRRKVVVLVTVDRQGVVCDVKPLTGQRELRKAAVAAVKKHWKYRPFLVDWKPVSARFPVSVVFVKSRGGTDLRACDDYSRPNDASAQIAKAVILSGGRSLPERRIWSSDIRGKQLQTLRPTSGFRVTA